MTFFPCFWCQRFYHVHLINPQRHSCPHHPLPCKTQNVRRGKNKNTDTLLPSLSHFFLFFSLQGDSGPAGQNGVPGERVSSPPSVFMSKVRLQEEHMVQLGLAIWADTH